MRRKIMLGVAVALLLGAPHGAQAETIAGLSGGVALSVTWTFASYSVQGNNVAPPLWDPLTQTLSGPGDFSSPAGFPNNFATSSTSPTWRS